VTKPGTALGFDNRIIVTFLESDITLNISYIHYKWTTYHFLLMSVMLVLVILVSINVSWWRGPAVEHRSLAGVLSLSCAQPVADG